MANTPLMEMPVDEFLAALDEFKTMDPSTDIDFLKREYDRVNSLTGGMNAEVDEGRTGLAGNFLSKKEGTTGWDAIRSLQFEPRAGATGVAQGVEQAITAPGRAARGTMPVQDTTMEALGTASMAMTGGLSAAGKGISRVDEDTVGIFGTRGVDWENQYEAGGMKQGGVSDDIIWEDTGLNFNPTNRMWEQEFDSSQMRIASKGAPEASEQRVASRLWQEAEELADVFGTSNQQAIPLGQVVQFDELFSVYPELEDVALTFKPGDGASYNSRDNMLTMGLETLQNPDTFELDLNKFKDVLVHEVQHAVQTADGSAPGSNPDWFARQVPKLKEDLLAAENLRDSVDALPLSIERSFARLGEESPYYAEFGEEFMESLRNPSEELQRARRLETDVNKESFRLYEATEGEIQSRAAEMRRYMTAEERAETPPSHTYRMALNRELDRYRSDVRDGVKQNYAEGGLVADVSNNAMADYFKAASGMMSEEEFVGKHKVSTKDFEDRFEENNNVDISGAESFKDITGTSKGENMPKRMNFNEGGMAVPVDPVSGNEIPPGSTPENVRDDIPVNMSEGEYVLTADVTKYLGLGFLEDLVTKAKEQMAGLYADERIGGQAPPDQIDPEIVRGVQSLAEGGLVSGNGAPDYNMLIDKVVQAAKTNPEIANMFQSRGISMAEGGMVQQGEEASFNPNDWQRLGGTYSNGLSQGSTPSPSAGGYEYVEYTGPNGAIMMVLHINGQPAQTIPEGFVASGVTPVEAGAPDATAAEARLNKDRENDRDRAQRITSGTGGGELPDFSFGDPLSEVDFDNPDAVMAWAQSRLDTDESPLGSFTGQAAGVVGGAIGGPMGSLLGRFAASGYGKLRDVAVINAAALQMESMGNTTTADALRTLASGAEEDYGLSGLVPKSSYDGSSIYENYASRTGQTPSSTRDALGSSPVRSTSPSSPSPTSSDREGRDYSGTGGFSGTTGSTTSTPTSASKASAQVAARDAGVSAKTAASLSGSQMNAGNEVGSGVGGSDRVGPMNKGGLVQRRYK